MPDKCLDCPAPSADMDGFIVSGPGGAPRSEGSGVSSPEGPFAKEAPQTGHVIIMGTLGADGNPGSLPDVPQVGWAYVAEDAGTYGGVYATEGDMVYCMSLNPVKWGVLQADSDDSGRDLVGVSAEVSCAGWRTAEGAELLAACCLRQDDDSGTCYGPDSASFEGGVLTVVWHTRWGARWLDMDVRFPSGEGRVRVDMSQIHSLVFYEEEYGIDDGRQCPPGGCVWNFEDVLARAALESYSGEPDPAYPQYERIITAAFRLEERPASSLDVYARAMDGTVSKSSSPLPCLDAAIVSAKADASCAGRIVPAESAKFYINFSDGEANYSEDIDARSGSFVLSGVHVDWAARNYSSSSYVRLSFFTGGIPRTLEMSYNDFANFFNGTRQPGYFITFNDESTSYGLVLAERTELTSEDEGGPDVLVRFQIVDTGSGPSVAVVAETLGGDVSVDAADLSCLNDRLTSVSASLGCPSFVTSSPSMLIGTDMMYYADDEFPSNFCDPSTSMTASLANGSFEIRGTDYNRMASACSTAATFAFILDSGVFGRITANVFADFFNGSIAQGGHIDSMNGKLRFVLDSRRELTSQDPGGPDVVVSLTVYEMFPSLTLTSTAASGEEEVQTVDMSCLVPPVFDGTENGLVPASGAAQNLLLAGNGTWMPPVSNAEIDALFVELV